MVYNKNKYEKNNEYICFQPNFAVKYIIVLFLSLSIISLFLLFLEGYPLEGKIIIIAYDIFSLFFTYYGYKGLRIFITINNNGITVLDKNTNTELYANWLEYSHAYCVYIKGAPYILVTKQEMNKQEREETMKKIVLTKKGNSYMDEVGNICFSTGVHFNEIQTIIDPKLKIEEKRHFDD